MRVLVTGGGGLIGSNVAAAVTQQSWDVLACQPHLADRKACVELAARWEPDVIVHAAGESSLGRFESDPHLGRLEFLAGEHMLAAARYVRARYVLISSDQVYSGRLPAGWRAAEADLPDPVNAHGRSKLACEETTMRSAVPWLIVRPGGTYGVNAAAPERPEAFLRLVARLRARMPLPAPRAALRSPIHARDFGQRLCELIAQGCEGVYNLGGPAAVDRHAWGRLVARAFRCREELVRDGSQGAYLRACGEDERVHLPANAALSEEKARAAIGASAVAPERGLELTRLELTGERVTVSSDAR